MNGRSIGVGDRLPDLVLAAVGTAAVERYANAAGDRNPIHLSEALARLAGLNGPIVHGMLMMGQFERLLRLWRPEVVILAVTARFLRPVYRGSRLRISGRVAKIDSRGLRSLIVRVMVHGPGETLACVGEARGRLANSGRSLVRRVTSADPLQADSSADLASRCPAQVGVERTLASDPLNGR